jgi:hypothetical protein
MDGVHGIGACALGDAFEILACKEHKGKTVKHGSKLNTSIYLTF